MRSYFVMNISHCFLTWIRWLVICLLIKLSPIRNQFFAAPIFRSVKRSLFKQADRNSLSLNSFFLNNIPQVPQFLSFNTLKHSKQPIRAQRQLVV